MRFLFVALVCGLLTFNAGCVRKKHTATDRVSASSRPSNHALPDGTGRNAPMLSTSTASSPSRTAPANTGVATTTAPTRPVTPVAPTSIATQPKASGTKTDGPGGPQSLIPPTSARKP